MEPTLQQVKELIAKLESFGYSNDLNDFREDVYTPNCDEESVEDNAYFEIKDQWGGLEFYDYVVLKGDYLYSIDAYNDGEIFGARVPKGSKDAGSYVLHSDKIISLD